MQCRVIRRLRDVMSRKACLISSLRLMFWAAILAIPVATSLSLERELIYTNRQYGFKLSLPEGWRGYSVLVQTWEGYLFSDTGGKTDATGPLIIVRHPNWTAETPRQDIPIMVITPAQWRLIDGGKLAVSAAGVGPGLLGHNAKYYFAVPARYNYAFPSGWEEVVHILRDKTNFAPF